MTQELFTLILSLILLSLGFYIAEKDDDQTILTLLGVLFMVLGAILLVFVATYTYQVVMNNLPSAFPPIKKL